MKELLCYLIAGTRGGPTRANIIQTIKNKPMMNWPKSTLASNDSLKKKKS